MVMGPLNHREAAKMAKGAKRCLFFNLSYFANFTSFASSRLERSKRVIAGYSEVSNVFLGALGDLAVIQRHPRDRF